jgi:hypothetical protein
VYYGYRPFDSLELHQKFSPHGYPFKQEPFPWEFREIPKKMRKVGMTKENTIAFDSCFECGNLDMVNKLTENEYDLYMRVDSNTHGHNQWFYFKAISNLNMKAKFNIVNFTKRKSLFTIVSMINRV